MSTTAVTSAHITTVALDELSRHPILPNLPPLPPLPLQGTWNVVLQLLAFESLEGWSDTAQRPCGNSSTAPQPI